MALKKSQRLHQARALFSQGLKLCSECKEIRSLELFYRCSTSWDGRGSWCKKCASVYWDKYKEKNREGVRQYRKAYNARPESKAKRKIYMEEWYRVTPRSALRNSLVATRKRKHLTDNPVTLDELCQIFEAQDGKCAISGFQMTWRQGQITATSMSIDRIDSAGGYTKSNVRLVCYAVNAFRGRMTDDEMLAMADAIISNMRRPKLRMVS